ncbi:MAG: hypothetical protein MJK04_16235 [Psychrosphaera sp.]|nr:hypothetical protein [Psychrosphaera sp.]
MRHSKPLLLALLELMALLRKSEQLTVGRYLLQWIPAFFKTNINKAKAHL